MTDIVQLCRSVPKEWVWANPDEKKWYFGGKWLHEAADEIERLREMVKYFACHCGGECDRSDGNCLISQAALGEKEGG